VGAMNINSETDIVETSNSDSSADDESGVEITDKSRERQINDN